MNFTATLDGRINGASLQLAGHGVICQSQGLVEGNYQLVGSNYGDDAIPEFDHHVFSALVITGYPSASRTVGTAVNPFEHQDHWYEREIRLSTGGLLHLSAEINVPRSGENADTLTSRFQVHGDARVPSLVSIDPLIETWVPIGGETVLGVFTMSWVTESGDLIAGVAQTTYHIPGNKKQIFATQHRLITINSTGCLQNFDRRQLSTLWCGEPPSDLSGPHAL